MLINCPKCDVSYTIDPEVIPPSGRKLRCTNCGEVFLCTPDDLENPTKRIFETPAEKPAEDELMQTDENNEHNVSWESENPAEVTESEEEAAAFSQEDVKPESGESAAETSEEIDETPEPVTGASPLEIQDIFQRLSEQSEKIAQQEQKMGALSKCCLLLRKACGWDSRPTRWMVYLLLLVIALLSAYYLRIEIVRAFPEAKRVYDSLGIPSTIPGEGLVFSNISRREYEDDYVRKMEIKGFIDNPTNHHVKVPELHLEILDKNAEVIQTLSSKIPLEQIPAHGREAFSIVVSQPSPLSKYILLTFEAEK